jgi:hypothetical protein
MSNIRYLILYLLKPYLSFQKSKRKIIGKHNKSITTSAINIKHFSCEATTSSLPGKFHIIGDLRFWFLKKCLNSVKVSVFFNSISQKHWDIQHLSYHIIFNKNTSNYEIYWIYMSSLFLLLLSKKIKSQWKNKWIGLYKNPKWSFKMAIISLFILLRHSILIKKGLCLNSKCRNWLN